jgi:hypothetical protein
VVGPGRQREHAGTQKLNDVRRVGGGEFAGLDEVPGDRVMPRVMALMIAARRSASPAGMAWAICAS